VTGGKDPDEFIQKNGREAFLKLVEDAVPAAEFRLRLARDGFDLSTDMGILAYIEKVIPVLRSLGPVEQELYVRKLSEEFGISEHSIMMTVRTEREGGRPSQTAVQRRRYPDRAERRRQSDSSIDERIEMSFALLALENTRYLRRYTEDGIQIRSQLASSVLRAAASMQDSSENGMHRIDPERIAGVLDPDEESVFRRYVSSVQIGPDDEAFYRETRASYLINNYKMEKSELMNELSIAEKTGREDEIEEIAGRLIRLDKLIDNINQTMEENNA
jgi:DNA primase